MKIFNSPGISSRRLYPWEVIGYYFKIFHEFYGYRWLYFNIRNWIAYWTSYPFKYKERREIDKLIKALGTGSYWAIAQGPPLQIEDVSPIMECITFDDKHIKLKQHWFRF